MATIAVLDVLLRVGKSAFDKGLKGASNSLITFQNVIGSINSSLAAIGAGVSVAGFAMLTKSTMKSINENINLADALKVNIEALTGLQYAAQLSGSSAEGLNSALAKMTENLGDAVLKSGPVADTLQRIGLDAKTLANQTPDKAFIAIAEAISRIQNPAERLSVIMDLFGKQGRQLANTLMLGRDGLARMAEEARKLGASFSDVDASQVRLANDAIDRMKAALQGLMNQFAIQLAPVIESAATAFTNWATSGETAANKVTTAMQSAATGVAFVADAIELITLGWKFASLGAMALGAEIGGLLAKIARVGEAIAEVVTFVMTGGKRADYSQLSDYFDRSVKELQEMQETLMDDIDKSILRKDAGTRVKEAFDEIRKSARAAAEEAAAAAKADPLSNISVPPNKEVANRISQLIDQLQEARATIGMTAAQVKLWKLEQAGADDTTVEWARSTATQVDQLTRLLDNLTSLSGKGDFFAEFADKVAGLEEMFASGRLSMDAFRASMDKLHDAFDAKSAAHAQSLRDKLAASAESLRDKVRTPLEQLKDDIKEIQNLFDAGAIDGSTFRRAMEDLGKDVREQVQSPMEKLQKEIEHINALFDAGAIDLETYDRAIKDAAQSYLDLIDATKSRPEAFEYGTQAAEQALTESIDFQRKQDKLQAMLDAQHAARRSRQQVTLDEPQVPQLPENAFDDFNSAMDRITGAIPTMPLPDRLTMPEPTVQQPEQLQPTDTAADVASVTQQGNDRLAEILELVLNEARAINRNTEDSGVVTRGFS